MIFDIIEKGNGHKYKDNFQDSKYGILNICTYKL